MNIEWKGPESHIRSEPLFLDDAGKAAPLWLIVTVVSGTIHKIHLQLKRPQIRPSRPLIANVLRQILLNMDNDSMRLEFHAHGTSFQKAVWDETCKIPHGHLATYGAIAKRIGCGSARAVGQALKKNPLPIIIPCHRVVGANGNLTGFSSGIEIKKRLIEFESKIKEGAYSENSNI